MKEAARDLKRRRSVAFRSGTADDPSGLVPEMSCKCPACPVSDSHVFRICPESHCRILLFDRSALGTVPYLTLGSRVRGFLQIGTAVWLSEKYSMAWFKQMYLQHAPGSAFVVPVSCWGLPSLEVGKAFEGNAMRDAQALLMRDRKGKRRY